MEAKEKSGCVLTCICCPMGCRMEAVKEGDTYAVTGNTCPRGAKYAVQELTDPRRIVTALVRVQGGMRPVCAVKTADTVPKAMIDDVLAHVAKLCAVAPVRRGDVLCQDIAGTGVKLIATADNDAAQA